jgi:membrane protease YdiL (CAAX protease family)
VLGAAGLAVVIGSCLWLIATGRGVVRYSADHTGTVALWRLWLPAVAGLTLTRVVPPRLPPADLLGDADARQVRLEAVVCTLATLVYAVVLPLGGRPPPDLWYLGVRIALLIVVPLAVLRTDRRLIPTPSAEARPGRWYWAGPAIPVAVWFTLDWIGPFGPPSIPQGNEGSDGLTLLVLVAMGFVINSLLEEIVYRFWLQTRLERVLGVWPGVVVTSLLWAAWHVAIQGTGDPAVDLAAAFARQGVLGLFLGALWARYRNPWAVIIVHGAINAPLSVFTGLS